MAHVFLKIGKLIPEILFFIKPSMDDSRCKPMTQAVNPDVPLVPLDVLQTLVIALGAGLGIWGAINLLEGYGNDNRATRSRVSA